MKNLLNRRRAPKGTQEKPEKHHWWPVSLLNRWAIDGYLSILKPGFPFRLAKVSDDAFFVRGAHDVIVSRSGPWEAANYSFEKYFDRADSTLSYLMKDLEHSRLPQSKEIDLENLWGNVAEFDDRIGHLVTELCASLIARSPQYRARLAGMISTFQNASVENFSENQWSTVAENQERMFAHSSKLINSGGKYAILISNSSEFCFGDGFYCNIQNSETTPFEIKFLIPILPTTVIMFSKPSSYSSNQNIIDTNRSAFIFNVSDEIVQNINKSTQIYSKNTIVYRNFTTEANLEIQKNAHMEYKYHIFPTFKYISDIMMGKHHRSLVIIKSASK